MKTNERFKVIPRQWLPILIAVVSLTITFFLWSSVSGEQRETGKRAVQTEAVNLQRNLETHITERILALERMADRWAMRVGGTPRAEWEADARRYVNDFGGFQAVSFIDPSYHVRWISPLEGNEAAVNMNFGEESRRRNTLDAARHGRQTAVSPPIILAQGGKGFGLYAPIYQTDSLKGFVAGIFRFKGLLDDFLLSESLKSGYEISFVADDGELIYDHRSGDILTDYAERQYWTTSRIINLRGVIWTMQLTPNRHTVAALGSDTDQSVLLIGAAFSFLLTAAAYLWQRARRQGAIAARSNEHLETEIAARRAVEAEQSRLVAILEASEDHIGMADAHGNIIYTNRAGRRMVGLPETGAITGAKVSDLHPEWAKDLVKNEALPTAVREGSWLGETALLAEDKSEIPTSQMILAHKNDHGEIVFFSTVARDISAQKKVESELKRSERRYRDLTEKSLGFISTLDLEGRVLSVNPAAALALGYQPEEVVGRLISDFMPDDKKRFMPDYFGKIRRDREMTALIPLLTADGEERVWKCSNVLYEDVAENQYILGYAQDITELKNTEKALEESRRIFESFMNNSPAVSYIKDETGTFMYASRHLSELFEVPLPEIYGKKDADFLPEDAAKEIRAKEKRIIETGVTEETLDTILMPDGEVHTWLSYKFPVENNAGGKILGGVSFDITERRRLEELLHETATLQRAILNSANYTVISTDVDGAIQSINQTAEQWLGYTAEELVGRESPALIHVAEEVGARAHALTEELGFVVEPGFEAFVAKARMQSVDEYEWTYVRKDGTGFPVLLSITALRDENDEITGYLGIGSDITERRQMQEELKKAYDAALESARLKSEFLANMSHEIRTPMNGVMGMTELLLDTELDAVQRSSAETIRDSADSLLSIINDILDFSKIEAGKLNFETIDFDLRKPVEDTVELFAAQTARKGVELISSIAPDVPMDLQGDPGRLRQILTNLIGNAVKFTERGEVVVRVFKECETERDVTLRFSINDTGIGIKPEMQKYLFQAFTQADGTTTRKYGGTGLGLAISKQLIELMDGEVKIESRFGVGSNFIFTARFEKQVISASTAKFQPRASLKNLRVLIVDDNETNRKILSYQTASWGMISEEAEGGKAALEKLRRAVEAGDPFDLAILDLMMPEMHGFDLARAIKSDERIADLRLILMPSYGQRGHGRTARETGIAGYLIKPVKQIELFECIAAVMGETEKTPVHTEKSVSLVTRHNLLDKRIAGAGRILVAEDNSVNQKVVTMQLERLGYRADVVANGRLAVQALERDNYSLVLMDCQMPEMDGYAATAEIRRCESGRRRVPVVALTANAMQGEREKCLAAGMDDYLAKPFKQEELSAIIKHWLDVGTAAFDVSAAPNITVPIGEKNLISRSAPPDGFEKDRLFADVKNRLSDLEPEIGGELIKSIIGIFKEDAPAQLENLCRAIQEENLSQIESEAHSLKGACANVGADYPAELCARIEAEAENGRLAVSHDSIEKLRTSLSDLIEILDEIQVEFDVLIGDHPQI